MESGVWWRALIAVLYSAKAMGVPSPSANCNLIAWLLAHCWQKKWQALLYTPSSMCSTLVPFYLDSKLLGARYLCVLCLSSTLHGGALLCDWMFLHHTEMPKTTAPGLLLGAETAVLCCATWLKKSQLLAGLCQASPAVPVPPHHFGICLGTAVWHGAVPLGFCQLWSPLS